jgi:hypothetical protein
LLFVAVVVAGADAVPVVADVGADVVVVTAIAAFTVADDAGAASGVGFASAAAVVSYTAA